MENSLFGNKLFLSWVPSYSFDITNVVLGILLILVSVVLFLLFTISYKKIRCKFPVRVNCWFCNNYTKVPYDFSNSWDCPHCNQYNGFNKDGDYNKVIHEQYNTKLNEDVFNILKKSVCKNKKNYSLQSNGFCKLCNINQQLKVQQLALFVPINENNYYDEIEEYREKLEKAYRLCPTCEKTLKETLEQQEYNLLKNRLNDHKLNFKEAEKALKYNFFTLLNKFKSVGIRGLKWAGVLLSFLLFFASILQFVTEKLFFHSGFLEYVICEPFQPIMEVVLVHLTIVHKFEKELSFLGFVFCMLSHSVRQKKIGQINLLFWVLVHISFWSNLTGIQILLCGISVVLNFHAIHNKGIYLRKKPLRQNYDFRPEKQIFAEIHDLREENSFVSSENTSPPAEEKFVSGVESSDVIESRKVQEIKTKSSFSGESRLRSKKKGKNRENEMEFVADEEREETRSKPDNSPANVKTNPLNSSIFNKSFLSTLENDKTKEEMTGSLDEVYSNLGGLNLGGKHKKSHKPSNYLFASHNFLEKKSSASSSVIKPAKFIRNLSSSWTGTESNESNSRSSTPSSGYSSQKMDKMESNRFDFAKNMTPLSVNPFTRPSPRDCFEYCDGNGGFYNSFNCFPQGFVPFQQFSSPLSHTTVYTYSRPTNFPFQFSPPSHGFPTSYKYSPTSTRFSDASDCDNLFQNASKTFENNKKWFKLKTISYYFSIFMNLITLVIFVFFVSAGVISVDWQLPKFNFFI